MMLSIRAVCVLCAAIAFALAACHSPPGSSAGEAGGPSPAGNVDPRIQEIVDRLRTDGVTADNAESRDASDYSTPFVKVDDRARIQVYVHVDNLDGAAEQLRRHGAEIELESADLGIVQAWLPAENIEAVASLDFVKKIEAPHYAHLR